MSRAAPARSLLRMAWNGVLDVVFPPQCVSCRSWGSFLCEACEVLMVPATGARCETCWQPGEPPCGDCIERPRAFDAVRAAYAFDGPARDLVHALKYRGVTAVAPLMAGAMTARLSEWGVSVDAIVPVPMAGTRRRRRGYNQAEQLAREIAGVAKVPVIGGAIRRLPGASQVEQPSRDARWSNASRAYETGHQLDARNVLLVDDAMTTGATLDACARVLKTQGASRVYGLIYARES